LDFTDEMSSFTAVNGGGSSREPWGKGEWTSMDADACEKCAGMQKFDIEPGTGSIFADESTASHLRGMIVSIEKHY